MLKVHILDQCPHCDGKAYLPSGQATDWKGEGYTRYEPCPICEGTGECGKWVNLPGLINDRDSFYQDAIIRSGLTLFRIHSPHPWRF